MEVFSSMPSAIPTSGSAAQDETGLSGMFSQTDGDSSDSIDADSFAALMQAFLAAAFPPPPPPKTREEFSNEEAQGGQPVSAAEPVGTGSGQPTSAEAMDSGLAAGAESAGANSSSGDTAAIPVPAATNTASTSATASSTKSAPNVDSFSTADTTPATDPPLIATTEAAAAPSDDAKTADIRATLPPDADDHAATDTSSKTDAPLTAAELLAYWQSRQSDSAPSQAPSGSTSIDPHRALVESALPRRQADDLAFEESDPLPLLSAAEFAAARTVSTDNGSAAFQSDTSDDQPSSEPAPRPAKNSSAASLTAEPAYSAGESRADRHPLPTIAGRPEAIGSFAFDQVLAHATTRENDSVSRIEAQIDPPELGRMRIEISKTPEGMTAHLTVEDPTVLSLLDQQMREVQQNLEAAGVPVASFTLSMSSDGQPSQQQSRRDDEQEPDLLAVRPRAAAPRAASRQREIDTTA